VPLRLAYAALVVLPITGVNAVKYIPLNFALMGNPYNWFVITLMVLIAGFGIALIWHPAHTGKDI